MRSYVLDSSVWTGNVKSWYEEGNNSLVGYYTCTTSGGTANKVVNDASGYVLSLGGSMKIKFTNKNTASTPTLNINGQGAKIIIYDGSTCSSTNTWEAGETVDCYYDGSVYQLNNVAGGGTFATGEKVKNVGIDSEPTDGSENLVKSGGVGEFLKNNLYDIPKCIINILDFAVEYVPYTSLKLTFSNIQFVSYPNSDNSAVAKNFKLNDDGTIDTIEFNASNGSWIYLLTDGTSPCLVQSRRWNPGQSKYLAFRFMSPEYSAEEQSFAGILAPFITQYFTFKTDKTVKQLSIDFNKFTFIENSIEGIQSATILNLGKSGQFNLGGLCDLNINNIKPFIDAFEPWWYVQGSDGGADVVYDETEQALKVTSGGSGVYCGPRTNIFSYLVPGKEYTFSIDIKSIQNTAPLFIGLQYPTSSPINIAIPSLELDGEWHTYTRTFIAENLGFPGDTPNPFYYIGILIQSERVSGLSFFAKNFKLICSSNTTKDLNDLSDKVDETNEKLIPLSVLNNDFDRSGELDLIEATDTQIDSSMVLQTSHDLGWVVFRGTSEFDSTDDCIIITKNSQNYGGLQTTKIAQQFKFGKEYRFSVEVKMPIVYDLRITNHRTTANPENIIITPEDTNWHTYNWSVVPYSPQSDWTNMIGFNTNAPDGAKIYIRNITCITDNLYKQLEFAYNFAKEGGCLDLTGKKISIIGDSISCFGTESQTRNNGYNAPYWIVKSVDVGQQIQSYVTWLDVYKTINQGSTLTNKTIGGVLLTPAMIGTLQTFTPVQEDIGKCIGVARWASNYTTKPWWQVLIDKTGATLCNNASWSGSRIVPIPEGNVRHDAFVLSEAYSDYTINRCANRDEEGNIITPDIIFIYRGTNDFVATDPEGGSGPNIPEDITTPDMKTFVQITDDYNFTQGYIWTVLKLRQKYPNAYIVLCTLNVFKYVNYSHYPSNNGTYTLPEYCNKIREIANLMGCGLIEFDKDGITFENCYPTYISDNSTTPLHPNTNGHRVMGEKAISDLKYYLRVL